MDTPVTGTGRVCERLGVLPNIIPLASGIQSIRTYGTSLMTRPEMQDLGIWVFSINGEFTAITHITKVVSSPLEVKKFLCCQYGRYKPSRNMPSVKLAIFFAPYAKCRTLFAKSICPYFTYFTCQLHYHDSYINGDQLAETYQSSLYSSPAQTLLSI